MKDWYFILIIIAAVLDIAANLLMQKSEGFRKKKYGISALVLVSIAFTILAQVSRSVDLTVAYISWGAVAILGTTFLARILFDQRLNAKGWLGIALIMFSIVLINKA